MIQTPYVLDQLIHFYQHRHHFPILNREMPPYFMYLEILRFAYAQNHLTSESRKITEDLFEAEPDQLRPVLTPAEITYWIDHLFPYGLNYLQKKSKLLYDLMSYSLERNLDVTLLKEYTSHHQQNANERGTASGDQTNESSK